MALIVFRIENGKYVAEKLDYGGEDDPYIVGSQEQADKAFYRRLCNELSDLCFEEDLNYSIDDNGIRIELGERTDEDVSYHSSIIHEESRRISCDYRLTYNFNQFCENGTVVMNVSFDPNIKPGLIL